MTPTVVDQRPTSPIVSTADRLLALGAAVLVFAVYLRTIYPGIFGLGDAAKFAFVGKVLGTPHPPGYPLYVLVSHAFSYLPIGSLAYRMNVLSAVLAALGVCFTYALARVLGLQRGIATATALSLGLGRAYWSKALYPKVYTLNAALVCAGLLLLLRWGKTRRPALLYGAIACFAIDLGNHLIIVSLVPALIAYALVTDARRSLAPRTVATALLLVALGLSQYGLILVRTLQHAPYLEARAENLRQLYDVITVRRWSHEIGAYTTTQLIQARVPAVAALVVRELTPAGIVLAAVGAVAMGRRSWREALLCLGGALGVLALTANMSSNEDEGFLLPAFVLLWLLAGVGLQWIVGFAARTADGRAREPRRLVAGASVLAAAAVPVWLVAVNYAANDHHRRTFEIRYFDALFRRLSERSAIVDDRYSINMMVKYKLLGENAGGRREIAVVPPTYAAVEAHLKERFEIFAFDEGRATLETLGYEFAPVPLMDAPLPQYLDAIPDGSIVLIAATRQVAPELRANRAGWRRVGVPEAAVFGRRSSGGLSIVGVAGRRGAAVDAASLADSVIEVAKGTAIGETGVPSPFDVRVATAADGATISVGGQPQVSVAVGAALVLIDGSGTVTALPLHPADGLRVPFDMRPLPLYRISARVACQDLGNVGWRDVSGLTRSGLFALRINNYRPFLSETTFYLASAAAATPQITLGAGRGTPEAFARILHPAVAAEREQLARLAQADGFVDWQALARYPSVTRYTVAVNDEGDQRSLRIDFGARPAAIFARAKVDLSNPQRATVCGVAPTQR